MSQEIQFITAETAEELIRASEMMREDTESSIEYLKRVRQKIEKEATRYVAKRNAYFHARYATAPWITRWWWKRKLIESEKTMRELAEIIRENNAGASDEK